MGLKTMLKYFPEITTTEIDAYGILNLATEKIIGGSKAKIYSTILESADQLQLNWELMQLGKVDIPGSAKSEINKIMGEPIYRFDKRKFKHFVYEDGLNDHFKYIDSMTFSILTQLDIYAES